MLKLMALYPADADLEGADFCPAGHSDRNSNVLDMFGDLQSPFLALCLPDIV
jgi:hypothetical protein